MSNFPTQLLRQYSPFQQQEKKQPMTSNIAASAANPSPNMAATSFDHNVPTSTTINQAQQPQNLLHRSPSGAQRKIRQKVQQQYLANGTNGGGHTGNNAFNGNQPNQHQQSQAQQQTMAYRHLIRDNAYRSILDGGTTTSERQQQQARTELPAGAADAFTVGQLIDRMNRLDPFPKSHSMDPSWMLADSQSVGCAGSIDKIPPHLPPPSHAVLSSSQSSFDHHQPPMPNKPTVQVYPLPVPPRHRSMSVISATSSSSTASSALQKPTPPPLPPKKHSLMTTQFALATTKKEENNNEEETKKTQQARLNGWQSAVLSSNNSGSPPDSFSHSQTSSTETTEFPGFTHKNQSTALRFGSAAEFASSTKKEKEEGGGMGQFKTGQTKQQHINGAVGALSPSPAFFAPPVSSLSSSPSLTSLQNSLHFAVENPEKHSLEQLHELEQRRLQSIESLAKKATEREQDRLQLCRDLEEVDQLRAILFARIGHHNLLGRLQTFLNESQRMAELETILYCQMAKLGETKALRGAVQKGQMVEQEEAARNEWATRLREQLNELHSLRGSLAIRERHLDAEMAEELGEAESLHEWLFVKEQLSKLCAERRQLEQRLRDVRELIESLQTIRLIPIRTNESQKRVSDDDDDVSRQKEQQPRNSLD